MSGHGHVTPNADGTRARCGGPSICAQCALEFARLNYRAPKPVEQAIALDVTVTREGVIECVSITDPVTGVWRSLFDSGRNSSADKTVRLTGTVVFDA